MNISFTPATRNDFDALLELRMDAMRESLEAIGRFNPQRSTERFQKSFEPNNTELILANGELAGFMAITQHDDHMYLDHLYIDPSKQSLGIGSRAIARVIKVATPKQHPIRLGALRSSRSNSFYQRHGFQVIREDEWDIYYERPS